MRDASRAASFLAAITIDTPGSGPAPGAARSGRGDSRAHSRSIAGYPAYTYATAAIDAQKTRVIVDQATAERAMTSLSGSSCDPVGPAGSTGAGAPSFSTCGCSPAIAFRVSTIKRAAFRTI